MQDPDRRWQRSSRVHDSDHCVLHPRYHQRGDPCQVLARLLEAVLDQLDAVGLGFINPSPSIVFAMMIGWMQDGSGSV